MEIHQKPQGLEGNGTVTHLKSDERVADLHGYIQVRLKK